jgi:hypothetical protein
MYRSIFETLYFGGINPAVRKVLCTSETQEIARKIQTETDCLRNELPPDFHQRLDELEELFAKASSMEDVDIFAHGFRTGALIMLGILSESHNI